jgi:hypothetical protein
MAEQLPGSQPSNYKQPQLSEESVRSRLNSINSYLNAYRPEIISGIKYDVVIKCRFDIELLEKVEIKLPENQIYIPIGWDHMDGVNDIFAYGDSESMDYYSSAFYSLDGFINECRKNNFT